MTTILEYKVASPEEPQPEQQLEADPINKKTRHMSK